MVGSIAPWFTYSPTLIVCWKTVDYVIISTKAQIINGHEIIKPAFEIFADALTEAALACIMYKLLAMTYKSTIQIKVEGLNILSSDPMRDNIMATSNNQLLRLTTIVNQLQLNHVKCSSIENVNFTKDSIFLPQRKKILER